MIQNHIMSSITLIKYLNHIKKAQIEKHIKPTYIWQLHKLHANGMREIPSSTIRVYDTKSYHEFDYLNIETKETT